MKSFGIVVAVLAMLAVGVAAQAGTILVYDGVALTPTDWNRTVSLPKFNLPGAQLLSIKVMAHSKVTGSAAFENLDNNAQTIVMHLQAVVDVGNPDPPPPSPLFSMTPAVTTVDNAAAYDGILNYAGPSGKTYGSLAAETWAMSVDNTPTLAIWQGAGTVDFPVSAMGTSFGSGAGNLALQFHTNALCDLAVEYRYEIIPEPATLALVGTAGIGLFGFIRRRLVK